MDFLEHILHKKEKATDDFTHLSPTVDTSYKLSNKFIEDFERIVEFIERNEKINREFQLLLCHQD